MKDVDELIEQYTIMRERATELAAKLAEVEEQNRVLIDMRDRLNTLITAIEPGSWGDDLVDATGKIIKQLQEQKQTLITQVGELEILIHGMQEGTLIPELQQQNYALREQVRDYQTRFDNLNRFLDNLEKEPIQ